MIKFLHAFSILIIFSVNYCFANIIKTNNFKVIEAILTQADSDVLVIFDVDETLITPKDAAMFPQYKNFLRNKIADSSNGSAQKQDLLWSIILRDQKPQLVDKQMPTLIKKIQKKGILTVALTSMNMGPHGVINCSENWRSCQLEDLGINFETSLENSPKIHLKLDRTGFYKGIIASSVHKKGDVLKEFLHQYRLKIKKIIFVDDNVKQIQSVEQCAKENGLKFTGVHYTAIADRPHQNFNLKRVELQFEVLEKEHKWLSDQEADARLEQESQSINCS